MAERLRIRRNSSRGTFELTGHLPDGTSFTRTLKANREVDTVEAALDLLSNPAGGRMVPTSALRDQERKACQLIQQKPRINESTRDAHTSHLLRVTSWLAERRLPVTKGSLMACIQDTPIDCRSRAGRIIACKYLAQAARLDFQVPPHEQHQRPPTKIQRIPVSDEEIFWFCREGVLGIKDQPYAQWLFRFVAITGVRMGSALSVRLLPEADISTQLDMCDFKRHKPNQRCMPTLRGLYNELNMGERPERLLPFVVPHDRLPTQAENRAINNIVKEAGQRFKYWLPDLYDKYSARNLRHAATCRLLAAGVTPFDTAILIQSSVNQIEKTYASHYRHRSVSIAGEKLLAAQN